jgi:hypothetical protein
LFLLVPKLAEESLSEDKEEGIGGTLTDGSFESISVDPFLLLRDCRDGVLENPSSFSLLFICVIALNGLLLGLLAGGRCRGRGLTSGVTVSSGSSTFEEREEGLDATGAGVATAPVKVGRDPFGGELVLDFASFLTSLGEGEGDLEDDVLHGLLARFRKVLETERPDMDLGFSVTIGPFDFLGSFTSPF